jgi:PAS domain S-box-containing protein
MDTIEILVVEDEGVVALDIQARLTKLGYAVPAVADTGEEAVWKAAEMRPDLVLMDIRLKGEMDGVEAAKRIRADLDIPVVYLTAYADETTVQRAIVSEPFGYLRKPIVERELQTTIDIALHKHSMEQKLRESERWLSTTLSSIGDAVIATDTQGRVQFINPAAEALTGWQKLGILGRDADQVCTLLNRTTRTPIECTVTRVLREGEATSLGEDILLVTMDKREISVEQNAAPIRDDQGQINGVVWVFRDISERVRLQERLAAIQRLGRELTLLHDEAVIVRQALETAVGVLRFEKAGYGVVDRAAGELTYLYHHIGGWVEDDSLRLDLAGEQGIGVAVVRGGRALNVPDVRLDPRYVPFPEASFTRSELCVPVKIGGRVIGVLNAESIHPNHFNPADEQLLQTLADQTAVALENARLYQSLENRMQTLQETQAQLIQSEKMGALGRLVASIAHEINNPLQAIQGCLTLTAEEVTGERRPDRLTRYLTIVETETERIAAIVRRVRDFYRPARDQRRLTDLHAMLEGVLELAAEELQHSSVTVEREWVQELPHIQANPDHLIQVFLNVVINAVDAMPEGGTLRIATGLDEMRGDDGGLRPAVGIAFSDTGPGMSVETQARLFEPFFTTNPQRTGLGLSISYQIIRAHEGEIRVESEEGVGTTCTVLLPLE